MATIETVYKKKLVIYIIVKDSKLNKLKNNKNLC